MLYHFYWICLIYGAKGAVDVAIVDCNKGVPDGGGMIHQRPTVHPQLCARIDIPACIAIFDIKGNPEDENKVGAHCEAFTLDMCGNPSLTDLSLRRYQQKCSLWSECFHYLMVTTLGTESRKRLCDRETCLLSYFQQYNANVKEQTWFL
ncbi:unnamed protein product [Dracunculus medinensis]|uniref:GDNF domain-containing protein n=1 Tax=Dracunculus medinensis TaxID=318479 RepID=A0A0N4US32_DRAME|nr:unnamed protein product [Dracunculus medinensis]